MTRFRYNRRRHRHWSYNDSDDYDYDSGILLVDFMFFNKTKKVIEDIDLNKLRKQIAKPKVKKVYWTNKVLGDAGVGFKLYKKFVRSKNIESYEETYISILEYNDLKLNPKTFNKCCDIVDSVFFLKYKPENEFRSFLNDLSINEDVKKAIITKKGHVKKFFKSREEVIDFLIEHKVLNGVRIQEYWEGYIGTVNSIFDKEIFVEKDEPKYETEYTHSNICHIIKVIEKRINNINYRVALINELNYRNEFKFKVFKEDDPDYVRIDKDRLFFEVNEKYYYLADGLIERNREKKLIVFKDIFKKMKGNINELITDDSNVITPVIYNFYKNRVINFSSYTNEELLNERQKQINEQYKKILKTANKIRFGDIQVLMVDEEYQIKLFNNEFVLKCKDDFLKVNEYFFDVKNALNLQNAQYNYNEIWSNLLKLSIVRYIKMGSTKDSEYQMFETAEFTINNIHIVLRKDNNRMKINNIFCRVDDVYHLLDRVICFKNQEEFDIYLKDVSHIGVDWKKLISSGITIQLKNPFFNFIKKMDKEYTQSNFYMRFSLEWSIKKRSQVFLVLNNKRYLIKYKGKFKRKYNKPSRSLSMNQLKHELSECLENITDDKILEIVDNAIEEAKIVKERGEELIKLTIKDIKADEKEIEINAVKKKGYLIIGIKTSSKYFVDKVDLGVYKWERGNWNKRCVVSAYNKERIFEDRLANRLINIFNEPSYITTMH